MKKPHFLKNPVFFLFLLITASSLTILIFSFLKLPETTPATGNHLRKLGDDLSDELGFFGKMMIEMLPEDLVFTAFVPSEKSFSRDLGLKSNNSRPIKSQEDDDGDNTYAVVSRIMSFAVVPNKVEEVDLGKDETASYESLSGFTLKIWKKRNGGGLVVNGIVTEKMGLKRGKIIAHIMNGVVMDSDFAQSLASSTPQDEDDP
ncbi:FAS1 domain [Arabidopsis thaliana x Arabidopsis arenosa]|uniref:FAS1 domain n=1 Tax=Arabidopsis thaliana x Arabidopsis arenosa TaxID=1240361 RepID=A0A8T1ZPM9_9BRAS|nr:FAS1 domain [Arabidopsis thaliana x Arabidopsis arenosa]